ncbi:TnsA endonuclease N-terminal domain-containing protein [Dyella sp. S184]|uniref:TnsA endonuclease N-terminal domain-containing protein n=1 Tax=Dyella sp. S184 TaxID=1641862 RepID=UPI00131B1A06|nr:TnsA endonuclease N-terminal domain-containing protein [Dyella sp. S184]
MNAPQFDLQNALRERARALLHTSELARDRYPDITIKHLDWWSRSIPLSHGCHSTGYAPTWPGQALLPVESRLERHVLKALTACPECVAVATQPVSIHYTAGGDRRSYTPDILVAYVCESTRKLECFLIEVKTKHQADRYRYKLMERQAAVTLSTALPLVVITEKDFVGNGESSHVD